jgi:GT2 family glycosyltransferase
MISFVVPAYNEEAFIADTLNAIHFSARVVGEQYEIVVADDASTDRTAEIARSPVHVSNGSTTGRSPAQGTPVPVLP